MSYSTFNVPTNYTDSTYTIIISITDPSHNRWRDTLRFPVLPVPGQTYGSPLTHVSGRSEWMLNVCVVNSAIVRNNTYEITIVDSVDSAASRGLTLRNLGID